MGEYRQRMVDFFRRLLRRSNSNAAARRERNQSVSADHERTRSSTLDAYKRMNIDTKGPPTL